MEHAVIGREGVFMTIEGGKAHKATEAALQQEKSTDMEAALTDRKGAGEKIYTVADIEALPDGERAELIDGEMFVMATPTLMHQEILGEIYLRIKLYVKENKGKCRVFLAPFAVYIKDDERNYVEPDIAVIGDPDKLDEKGCHGAPDWVIEIVSVSSRHMDYVTKLALYESSGVREYWLVDPQQESVVVYNFERKEEPEQYSFSEKIKAGIYDDFYIDFSELR